MIDITQNEEDKDKYITKVYLKEDANKFIKRYASGRLEEQDFTISQLNQTLFQMEKQYLQYREEFIASTFNKLKKVSINKLIEAFIAIAGVYLTSQIDMPSILKILIATILVVGSICYQRKQSDIEEENESNLRIVATADEFLEHKDKFKIKVKDPNTATEEDWYLLTLSDIETVFEPKLVAKLAQGLTPEAKEEQSQITTEVLEKRMKLS